MLLGRESGNILQDESCWGFVLQVLQDGFQGSRPLVSRSLVLSG